MANVLLSFEEYRVLVEQAPIMIWRSNAATECDYFNERWLAFSGRTLEQEKGTGWAEGVHPEDFSRCLEIYLGAFRKRDAFEMEYRLRRSDGTYRWIFDRGVPFNDADGQFAGYIGSCIDVTDRVEAQAALRKAQDAELKMLQGLLPICANCKNIRDDKGYWRTVESYVKEHSEAEFTHGICPQCMKKLYPGLLEGKK